jgi:hypothetical protein
MSENRLVVRMMGYWERIRKDEHLPDFRKNNPAMIEDLWQQCFVLSSAVPKSTIYKYEFIGEKVKDIYKQDLTGQVFDLQGKDFPNLVISPRLREIGGLDIPTPQEISGQVSGSGGKIIKYRIILLPFGNQKNVLTHVIAGVSFIKY